jgi:hypothetical protein
VASGGDSESVVAANVNLHGARPWHRAATVSLAKQC